jgi:hypothetical protein
VPDQNVPRAESQPSIVMTAASEGHRRPVSQLSIRELDLYGNQLERCLKALSTDAPIRADVQRNWPRCTPYGNHAPKPASPSNPAALAMSAG